MSPYKMSKIEESIRITLKFFDCLNKKDIKTIGEVISSDCKYDDIWENKASQNNKKEIQEYLVNLFNSYPNISFIVTDANNLIHKCIAKYNIFGMYDDESVFINCIGLFEVKNHLITSVSLYAKK